MVVIISGISKSEAINLMQIIDLTKRSRTFKEDENLLSHIKMVEEIIKFGNIEIEKKNYHYNTPI